MAQGTKERGVTALRARQIPTARWREKGLGPLSIAAWPG